LVRVRSVLTAVLVAVTALAFLGGAPAEPATASQPYDAVVDLTFPVAGPVSYLDDYAYPRSGGRTHRATDVMAPYGARVHAVVGGMVDFITGIDGPVPSYGYMIRIAGDDGRRYSYIHLGAQDRGPSEAYAPGLHGGVRVARGQWIGYVGHSGNATPDAPHLHFEIQDDRVYDPYAGSGDAPRMNPYPSLRAAQSRGDVPTDGALASECSGTAFAFAGDWDGSGRDGLGWWCDGDVRLRTASGRIYEFRYGRRGDVPVVADWNGNRRDTVSVIRNGRWHVNNALRGGAADRLFTYGRVTQGDQPVAGDWSGRGRSLPGIIRDTHWHLRDSQSGGAATWQFRYGRLSDGDLPLWGDWNGDGRATPGIVRNGRWHLRNRLSGGVSDIAFTYGRVTSGDLPVVGDWNGDGRSSPAIVRGDRWHLKYRNRGGAADTTLTFPRP
jgi:murein DD-endopeptidase MepM/ murein hydrolase activator NlpD